MHAVTLDLAEWLCKGEGGWGVGMVGRGGTDLFAQGFDLDVGSGQYAPKVLHHTSCLEEIFRPGSDVPQQVCLHHVLDAEDDFPWVSHRP